MQDKVFEAACSAGDSLTDSGCPADVLDSAKPQQRRFGNEVPMKSASLRLVIA